MSGLPPDRRLPFQAEPGEVVMDPGLEFGTAAGDVDILDAQEKPAAESAGAFIVEQGRKGMPEMEPPVGAGSKAKNRLRHRCLHETKGMNGMATLLETDEVLGDPARQRYSTCKHPDEGEVVEARGVAF